MSDWPWYVGVGVGLVLGAIIFLIIAIMAGKGYEEKPTYHIHPALASTFYPYRCPYCGRQRSKDPCPQCGAESRG